MTKQNIFLLAILAIVLLAGPSPATGAATMVDQTGSSEPILKESDEYPTLDKIIAQHGVAPAVIGTDVAKSDAILRETDEYPSLGKFSEHYGLTPAWISPTIDSSVAVMGEREVDEHYGVAPVWTDKTEAILFEKDEIPSLGHGKF